MNIFIFHNDLRLADNVGLMECIKDKTIPVFIFTPTQIGNENKYRSQNAINFMCNSLAELDKELKMHGSRLHTYFGHTHKIISQLIRNNNIKKVYCNRNYTPFAIDRDKAVEKVCKSAKVEFIQFEDFGLLPIGSVKTGNEVYKKFTPYYEAAKHHKVHGPYKYKVCNLVKISGGNYHTGQKYSFGGREQGLAILAKMDKFKHYGKERNILAKNTTQLSAYIKFGCVSIREVYHKATNTDFIKQLFWREFFMNIVWVFPHVLNGRNRNFKLKYNKVRWTKLTSANKHYFLAWCNGQTGYPIVDACMRQLNTTGWMHNRGRLIVSGFLVKIMGWDWQYGERYFAIKLRDYDPAQNSGGWQFVSGSGVDSQPYFRIFNPWLQAEKYDPNCEYIKKWCPELAKVPTKDIHFWYKNYEKYKGYPKPMIDYETWRDKSRLLYSPLS